VVRLPFATRMSGQTQRTVALLTHLTHRGKQRVTSSRRMISPSRVIAKDPSARGRLNETRRHARARA
jgi:hypothetical protein